MAEYKLHRQPRVPPSRVRSPFAELLTVVSLAFIVVYLLVR
jgi:hypothetical protein